MTEAPTMPQVRRLRPWRLPLYRVSEAAIGYLVSLLVLFAGAVMVGVAGRIVWEGLLLGWRILP